MFGALGQLLQGDDDDEENPGQQQTVIDPRKRRRGGMYREAPLMGRGPSGFVGLENQGATCYLNSLIQMMFMTPELRQGLFQLNPKELGVQWLEEQEEEKEAASAAAPAVVTLVGGDGACLQLDPRVVDQLVNMGFSIHGSQRAAIACQNESAESRVEKSLEWALLHSEDPDFDQPLPGLQQQQTAASKDKATPKGGGGGAGGASSSSSKKNKPRIIPLELQRLFSQLQLADKRTLATQDLTSKWGAWDGRVQHDVHELVRLLIDALERSLVRTPGEKLMGSLYGGLLVYKVTCLQCGAVSEREEPFYDVMVNVKGFGSLIQSLADQLKPEKLEGANQYQCEGCNRRVNATRAQHLRTLPPILLFSLNRFEYDMATLQRVKLTTDFRYPMAVDMRHLMEDKDGPPDWYDLFGVVIHQGSAYSGHYHAYLRDWLHEGHWEPPPAANHNKAKDTTTDDSKASTSDGKGGGGNDNKEGGDEEEDPLSLLRYVLGSSSHGGGARVSLSHVGSLIKEAKGWPWNRLYKDKHGALPDFIARHPDAFILDTKANLVTLVPTPQEGSSNSINGGGKDGAHVGESGAHGQTVDVVVVEDEEEEEDTKNGGGGPMVNGGDSRRDKGKKEKGEPPRSTWEEKGGSVNGIIKTPTANGNHHHGDASHHVLAANGDGGSVVGGEAGMAERKGGEGLAGDATTTTAAVRPPHNWFDFDDGTVRPIKACQLSKAFSGRDSAYLLVYRRRSLPLPTPTPLAVPEPWRSRILEENTALQHERDRFETEQHRVSLTVLTPRSLRYEWPHVVVVPQEKGGGQGLLLTLDERASMEQVKEEVINALGGPDHAFNQGVPSEPDLIHLHILKRRTSSSKGIHGQQQGGGGLLYLAPGSGGPLTTLHNQPDDILVLAWDGAHIGDKAIDISQLSQPITLTLTRLTPPPTTTTSQPAPGVAAIISSTQATKDSEPLLPPVHVHSSVPLHISTDTTIDDLLRIITTTTTSSPDPSEEPDPFAPAAGSEPAARLVLHGLQRSSTALGATTSRAVLLYTPTSSKSSAGMGEERRNRAKVLSHDWPNMMQDGGEILVEALEARGLHRASLAEAEVYRRNKTLLIWVMDRDKTAVEMQVDDRWTVRDLVRAMTTAGSSSQEWGGPLVVQPGDVLELRDDQDRPREMVDEDEDEEEGGHDAGDEKGEKKPPLPPPPKRSGGKSLAEWGVKEGSRIVVKTPSEAALIRIRFRVVSGNDPQPKLNRERQGVKGPILEVEVRRDGTVAEAKAAIIAKATVAVAMPPPGGAGSSTGLGRVNDGKPRRLRMTNFLEEGGELLQEDDIVRTSPIARGEVVLLEEGRLPVKGEICLSLRLWNPPDDPNGWQAVASHDSGYGGGVVFASQEEEDAHMATEMQRRASMMVELPRIFAMSDWPLSKLKEVVWKELKRLPPMPDWAGRPFMSLEGAHELVIRELREADQLPGMVLREHAVSWGTKDQQPPQQQGEVVLALGGEQGEGELAVAAAGRTLKKLNMTGGRPFVVQVPHMPSQVFDPPRDEYQAMCRPYPLPQQPGSSSSMVGPAPPSLRLWLYRMADGTNRRGRAIFTPAFPPYELSVSGGAYPTMRDLQQSILPAIDSNLNPAHFHHFPHLMERYQRMLGQMVIAKYTPPSSKGGGGKAVGGGWTILLDARTLPRPTAPVAAERGGGQEDKEEGEEAGGSKAQQPEQRGRKEEVEEDDDDVTLMAAARPGKKKKKKKKGGGGKSKAASAAATATTTATTGGGGAAGGGASSSVLDKCLVYGPWNLRDGDVIAVHCALEKRQGAPALKSGEEFDTDMTAWARRRAERRRAEEKRQGGNKGSSGGGGSKKKHQTPEVALQIGLDLSFSDSDDDGDDGDDDNDGSNDDREKEQEEEE